MVDLKKIAKKAVTFVLSVAMVVGNFGGIIYGAQSESDVKVEYPSKNGEELALADCEVTLNRNGGLNSVYYPAYEMAPFDLSVDDDLKNRIIATLNNYKTECDISDFNFNLNDEESMKIFEDVMNEVLNNYRYFYVNGFSCSYYPSTGEIAYAVLFYRDEYVNSDNTIIVELIQQDVEVMDEKVDYALSFVSDDMSDLEKALVLHDYIVSVCDYDYGNYLTDTIPADSYAIWGVLVNELAVCQGYAEAYSALLQEVGIDSMVIGSSTMNHAWNMVYLDDNWYHVDATWDDPIFNGYTWMSNVSVNNDYADLSFVSHSHFLKSDEEMLGLDHNGWVSPVTGDASGIYEGYAFDTVNVKNLMYYDSEWYYQDFNGSDNVLYKVNIANSSKSSVSITGTGFGAGNIGKMVYYGGKEGIYSYDLSTGDNKKVVDISATYPGYELTEFVVRYNSLRGVLYNSSTGNFQDLNVPLEMEKVPVNVSGVALNLTEIKLTSEGETRQLVATVTPSNADNKAVSWTSSNSTVATVSETGLVTAVANGEATITATTYEGGLTATCKVWVDISQIAEDPIEAFVERMYTVALKRAADEDGVANWVAQLKSGVMDGAGIAQNFILGEEFAIRGFSDEEFLDILYQTFFDREADADGKLFWLSVLAAGNSRAFVLSNFVNLDEFTIICGNYGIERGLMLENGTAVNPGIPQFVKRLYTNVLGRTADNEGLKNYTMALLAKAETAESVAKNFLLSEEYVAMGKNNEEFVADLYTVFMNRAGDAGGIKFWVDTMVLGMDKADVIGEFAKSAEFKAIARSYGLE